MTPATDSRLRGGVVGATSALTGIAAHAAAQGMLPQTSTLLLIAAATTALGIGVSAAPRIRVLPALLAGQGLVHLLLVVTSGHHHDLFTAPMAVMHAVGTVAALLLLTGIGLVVHAVSALAIAMLAQRVRPCTPAALPTPPFTAATPVALVFLGSIGRRGPPASV